ncbi:right-handed parallel beta-helix repeat-containing protein [bacterium]|nr:right-handed parallel beta-helix repeat-containing protein [bacterium]
MICLMLCLGPALCGASVRHVNAGHPQASDGNPGTASLPWRTIQHAAGTAAPGDTVYIHTGTYHEHVYMEQSGAEGSPVAYLAWPGETPVLDGTGVTASGNGLVISASRITIRGLEFRSWPGNAVWIEQSSHLDISDCTVHGATYGVGVADGSHDIRFTNVTAFDFDLYGFDVSPSGGAPCHDIEFSGCSAHSGRDPQQNVDGFALGHGSQYGFSFTRCTVHDVYDGFDISARSTVLNGCCAHDCWNGGYKLWQDRVVLSNCIGYRCGISVAELDWDGDPGLTAMYNCTFFDSGVFTVWVENSADSLRMYNCIISGGDNIGLAFEQRDAGNYSGDYNIFHNDNTERGITAGYEDEFSLSRIGGGEWTAYSGQDSHSFTAGDPSALFQDPSGYDLRLHENSIAVDAGTSAHATALDFAGNPRPRGSGYDIGAYEFQGTSVPVYRRTLPEKGRLGRNYPNPFNPRTTIPYTLPHDGHVTITIHTLLGRRVTSLVDEWRAAGFHAVSWDGRDDTGMPAASGTYIVLYRSGTAVFSRKLMLLR